MRIETPASGAALLATVVRQRLNPSKEKSPMIRLRSLNCLRSAGTALVALLLCTSLVGCGSSEAEVSGTVRCDGKPLPYGNIQFLGADGIPCAGQIQADGTFTVRVPLGQAKVIVSCVDEAKQKRFVSKAAANHGRSAASVAPNVNFSLIPQRYADWNTSGLTVLVKQGKTMQDFDLTTK
jgi:hypothetical protein